MKCYLCAFVVTVGLIFLLPYYLRHSPEDYWRTVTILLPIAVAVFLVPVASFLINRWDIHFEFHNSDGGIRFTVFNLGAAPFNFNRVSFASDKRPPFLGKREHQPIDGMFDEEVECHGADMSSRILHGHVGVTVRQGMPVSVWLRGNRVYDYLRYFRNRSKVYICLYYQGTSQRVYSQPIPEPLIERLLATKE